MAAHSHDSLLRQKARSRWIKEGDCNSRYFHLLMNASRRHNLLKGIMIEGSWVDEPLKVKVPGWRCVAGNLATRLAGLSRAPRGALNTGFAGKSGGQSSGRRRRPEMAATPKTIRTGSYPLWYHVEN